MYQEIKGTTAVKRLMDGKYIARNPQNPEYIEYLKWKASNRPHPAAPKSPEAVKEEIVAKTQERLDQFAQTKGYDGILSACSYDPSADPKFKQDAERAVFLRDLTWRTLYSLLDEVLEGTRPVPQDFSDVEGLLPVLTW